MQLVFFLCVCMYQELRTIKSAAVILQAFEYSRIKYIMMVLKTI